MGPIKSGDEVTRKRQQIIKSDQMQLIVASSFVLLCGCIYTGEGKIKERETKTIKRDRCLIDSTETISFYKLADKQREMEKKDHKEGRRSLGRFRKKTKTLGRSILSKWHLIR